MKKSKNITSPSASGGSGYNFETQVQALFIVLMLTNGHAPCLPASPIVEIILQGKIDGYDTDDLIVITQDKSGNRNKLLGQIKHNIAITESNPVFGEVMQAAWNDFNNPNVFTKGSDVIALISGPLTTTDADVTWILNHAREHKRDTKRFFNNAYTAKFFSNNKRSKLNAIHKHLKDANNGLALTDEKFHSFLTSFYLLGYDLGEEEGVVLSLLTSHITQFKPENSRLVWSRILEYTRNANQHAGHINIHTIPKDIISLFQAKPRIDFPEELKQSNTADFSWSQYPNASHLALIVLIGSWNEKNEYDRNAVTKLVEINYNIWIKKTQEILQHPNSPLSLKNGSWKITDRAKLWTQLGMHIFDDNLSSFILVAKTILAEINPALDLPVAERFMSGYYGKTLTYSPSLRNSLAEGLAILSSQQTALSNCSDNLVKNTATKVLSHIFTNADWKLWASIYDVLPLLSESAPDIFLEIVEKYLQTKPCPFDELFAQESHDVTSTNYMAGILWSLEALAWEERYFIRVCIIFSDLASHDPGGVWTNRPINSLVTILLPWLPQTLASFEKRKLALQIILREHQDIGWKVLIQLLPGVHKTSSHTYKPIWRKIFPDGWKGEVTQQEYLQQVNYYAELAVTIAGTDTSMISTLIQNLEKLPQPTIDFLLQVLSTEPISQISGEQKTQIWNLLTRLIEKYLSMPKKQWLISQEQIDKLEQLSDLYAPTQPNLLYQRLFTNRNHNYFEEIRNWEEHQNNLNNNRKNAITEIYRQQGIDGVIRFAESVAAASDVGFALSSIAESTIDSILFPVFLATNSQAHKLFVHGYILGCYHNKGWSWCDTLDKSQWSHAQIGQFLAYLPFTPETWNYTEIWLQSHEHEYWIRTNVDIRQNTNNLSVAINKLLQYHRPLSAIDCIYKLLSERQKIDHEQCIRALFAAATNDESHHSMHGYQIIELIRYLQLNHPENRFDIVKIEWTYIQLIDNSMEIKPLFIETDLATQPNFFNQIIRLVFRSTKNQTSEGQSSNKEINIAQNGYLLLNKWSICPGTTHEKVFNSDIFNKWLAETQLLCEETGHLDIALNIIGGILIYAPRDPDGLWIHRTVADVLNIPGNNILRRGFTAKLYNSRGAHIVDPTGKPERELAVYYRQRSDDVENAGYSRLATVLKNLADEYEDEAQKVISEY
jgi:hypothetical protein